MEQFTEKRTVRLTPEQMQKVRELKNKFGVNFNQQMRAFIDRLYLSYQNKYKQGEGGNTTKVNEA